MTDLNKINESFNGRSLYYAYGVIPYVIAGIIFLIYSLITSDGKDYILCWGISLGLIFIGPIGMALLAMPYHISYSYNIINGRLVMKNFSKELHNYSLNQICGLSEYRYNLRDKPIFFVSFKLEEEKFIQFDITTLSKKDSRRLYEILEQSLKLSFSTSERNAID
jgi:hypothetical protein